MVLSSNGGKTRELKGAGQFRALNKFCSVIRYPYLAPSTQKPKCIEKILEEKYSMREVEPKYNFRQFKVNL